MISTRCITMHVVPRKHVFMIFYKFWWVIPVFPEKLEYIFPRFSSWVWIMNNDSLEFVTPIPRLQRVIVMTTFLFLSSIFFSGDRDRAWGQRRTTRAGSSPPAARPPRKLKETVEWFEGSHAFAYRASPDTRLLIRHAPIPRAGSPWPMPQRYQVLSQEFLINHKYFRMSAIGETCDILQFTFERVYRWAIKLRVLLCYFTQTMNYIYMAVLFYYTRNFNSLHDIFEESLWKNLEKTSFF